MLMQICPAGCERRRVMTKKGNSSAPHFPRPATGKDGQQPYDTDHTNRPNYAQGRQWRKPTRQPARDKRREPGRARLTEKRPYWGQKKALPRRPAGWGGHCGARHTQRTSVRARDGAHVRDGLPRRSRRRQHLLARKAEDREVNVWARLAPRLEALLEGIYGGFIDDVLEKYAQKKE